MHAGHLVITTTLNGGREIGEREREGGFRGALMCVIKINISYVWSDQLINPIKCWDF